MSFPLGPANWSESARRLTLTRAVGSVDGASWELEFGGAGVMFPYLPRHWMYRAPVPRTKAVSVEPRATFHGRVTAGGHTIEVSAPDESTVAWRYSGPAGGERYASNCSVAALALTVRTRDQKTRLLHLPAVPHTSTAHGSRRGPSRLRPIPTPEDRPKRRYRQREGAAERWAATGARADIVGIFPDDQAAIRLAGALLIEQNDEWPASRRYLSEESLALVLADHDRRPEEVIPELQAAA